MGGYSLKAWASSLGLLAGAWAAVVVLLGSLLPAVDAEGGRLTRGVQPQHRSTLAYPLWIARKVPCTNEPVTLDLSLVLDTKWRFDADGEWVDFVIHATLTSSPSVQAPDEIVPATAHFGFSSPQYGQAGHVHEMHAALVGQPAGTELRGGHRAGDGWPRPVDRAARTGAGGVCVACGSRGVKDRRRAVRRGEEHSEGPIGRD